MHGVPIDSNLTWYPHCNYIANKLSRICGVVSRLEHYVPTHILTLIYNSLFLSHISYGITYWGFNICTRISKLQKKVIIFLTNSKFNSHTAPLFKQLGLLKAVDIIKLACFINVSILRKKSFHTIMSVISKLNTPIQSSAVFVLDIKSLNLFKNNYFPKIVLEKMYNHSYSGFTKYAKTYTICKYKATCKIPNCYVCKKITNTAV